MNDIPTFPSMYHRAAFADAVRGTRRVFVRDLMLSARIGVYASEHTAPQPIVVNIDMLVPDDKPKASDDLADVVCYHEVVKRIRALCAREEHVNLLETLADEMAAACLRDARVIAVRLRIEKPQAIAEAAGVGIEIERLQPVEPADE